MAYKKSGSKMKSSVSQKSSGQNSGNCTGDTHIYGHVTVELVSVQWQAI